MRACAVKVVHNLVRGAQAVKFVQTVRGRVGIARTFSMDSQGGTVARKPPTKSSLMKLSKSELAIWLGQMGLQVRTSEGLVLLLACT